MLRPVTTDRRATAATRAGLPVVRASILAMAESSSAENPVQVRQAARMLSDYLGRLGELWVEGQIAELRRRKMAFLTLRDTTAQVSIPVVVSLDRLKDSQVDVGQRVIVQVKLEYWSGNGQLQWRARQLQPVGEGALLRQLEALKKTLAAEGLFAAERKRPLPFLPNRVGLICGRRAAAYDDVIVNARDRWPSVAFEIREVAVQGTNCVPEVVNALEDLDGNPDVDVIVIARGGGSFEDLLGFSNEALVRAVASSSTPVVSAIGHEEDSPILDHVADLRASTPTAAGKLIVPDAAAEAESLLEIRQRLYRTVTNRLVATASQLQALTTRLELTSPSRLLSQRREEVRNFRSRNSLAIAAQLTEERTRLTALRQRPGLARPEQLIQPRREAITQLASQLRRCQVTAVTDRRQHLAGQQARLTALSPQGTLDRGYAVVRRLDGGLILDAADVMEAEPLSVRVRSGSFPVIVTKNFDQADEEN